MIENFQKFDKFDNDGNIIKSLLPLSFSHLTEFAYNRERWAMRRIFGYEFPTSAAAERGSAVEAGLNMLINGLDESKALKGMLSQFDANVSKIDDPKIPDERDLLYPLMKLGYQEFQKYAFQWDLIGYQKKIETYIKGIPLIGYTDFHFEDKKTKEDFFIDLKTTRKAVNNVSMGHQMQQSIYHRATNSRQLLWYLVGRKKDCEFMSRTVEDLDTPMKICEHAILNMGAYLGTVNNNDDIKQSIIPNIDDYRNKDIRIVQARKEIWGF